MDHIRACVVSSECPASKATAIAEELTHIHNTRGALLEEKATANPQLFSPVLLAALIVQFCVSIAIFMMMPSLPVHLQANGASKAVAGLSTALFTFAALIFRPIAGLLLDSRKKERILFIGLSTLMATIFLTSFFKNARELLAFRFFQGIGFSAYSSALGSMIPELVPAASLVRAIAFQGVMNSLGTAVGPAIGLASLRSIGLAPLLWIAASFVAIALSLSLWKLRGIGTPKVATSRGGSIARRIFARESFTPSSFALVLATSYGCVLTFAPVHASAIGAGDGGHFFIAFTASMIVTRFFANILSRNAKRAAPIAFISIATALVIIALAPSETLFLLGGAIYGAAYGIVLPILNATALVRAGAEHRGAGTATFYSAIDIGIGSGSILWGTFAQTFGFKTMFLACGATILIAGLAMTSRRVTFLSR